MRLSELIRDNEAYFSSYRAGFFYYIIHFDRGFGGGLTGPTEVVETYQFVIPREDFENATLSYREKAITLTKWIKAAMDKGELIKLPNK